MQRFKENFVASILTGFVPVIVLRIFSENVDDFVDALRSLAVLDVVFEYYVVLFIIVAAFGQTLTLAHLNSNNMISKAAKTIANTFLSIFVATGGAMLGVGAVILANNLGDFMLSILAAIFGLLLLLVPGALIRCLPKTFGERI